MWDVGWAGSLFEAFWEAGCMIEGLKGDDMGSEKEK